MNNNYNLAQQGWQCSICKRVYSPFTSCCFSCGAEGMTKTPTDWIEHQNEPYKEPNFTGTGYAPYVTEDKSTCGNCKHNPRLSSNNGTIEYSVACKNCVAKDM